jgi:hypothetical protein
VDVPPKNVVTFKPGKLMEEKVRQLTHLPVPRPEEEEEDLVAEVANGRGEFAESSTGRPPVSRSRKAT